MKRIIFALALLCASAYGQSLAGVNGDCGIGGQQPLTSGLPATATQQIGTTNVNAGAGVLASFPGCIVTVYNTGTVNKANIFSDNNLTPTVLVNPFTANTDGSFTFFVAQGACYDITLSSGTTPMPYNRTLTDVCEGTGSGGGGANLAGTLNHVVKFTSATSGGDSEGIATGIVPASWPLGLDIVQAPLEFDYPNSPVPGTTRYLLVSLDGTGSARNAQPTDANNLLGVADAGAGTTGKVSVATYGVIQLTMDNQTAINDYVILGSGSMGHDAGATEPVGVQNIARVQSVNGGAGTNAVVRLGLPDVVAPTTTGGTGTVSPCSTVGAIAYYAATGNVVQCDPHFTTDGAGNVNGISVTLAGPSAGFIAFGQSSVPGLTQLNSSYWYAQTSIPTTFGTAIPHIPGTAGQVLTIASVTDATHIVTEWQNAGAGNSNPTCMLVYGADNASAALINTDIAPQGQQCFIPRALTAIEINVSADGGTPSVVVSKVSPTGTVTALLSTALATAAAGAFACSNTGGTVGINGVTTCSATLQNTSLPAGYYLQTTTATAGGTAKRISIAVVTQ